MDEQWMPIPNFIGYEASNLGNIRSYRKVGCKPGIKKHPRVLKPYKINSNYLMLTLRLDSKKSIKKLVSHLVLEAFKMPRPGNADACHWDGDRHNNAISNLRWATRKENEMDKTRHGTRPVGEKAYQSKLTEAQVIEMRQGYKKGIKAEYYAEKFGTCVTNAYWIIAGKSWKHIKV